MECTEVVGYRKDREGTGRIERIQNDREGNWGNRVKERKKYYLSCRGDKFQALQTKGRKNDIWKKSEIEKTRKRNRE